MGADIGLYIVENTGKSPRGRMWYSYNADSSICGWVYNFYKAPDGSIYIGKRNGFAKVRMLNDSLPQLIDFGLDGLPIRHFYKSNTQILWIASEQGLIAYNETTHKYKVFDEAAGIANSYVYAILPQNDSTLWVSTNKGISQVNIRYGDGNDVKAKFTNYTSKDGLQSNEFNTGAFFKCADGTLMFGGIAGVNWFNPANIKINPYKAIPAITGVYVNDTLMNRDTTMYMQQLVLPYARNTISFTLRALEYTLQEQNSFAYMLEGHDRDWVYTTGDKARYSNLPPGNYRFLLKVSNNENLWNEQPLALRITILPPYWQTWWFRLLVVLALALTAFFAARYYIRQRILVKTRELEKQHALNMERIRISKDVHDDIGSGLSKISLLSEIANKKIRENQPHGKDISNITAISKELVDNMRDLIWVLNPENTTLDNLVSRIREYCADYIDGVNIAAIFNFPELVPAINISREVQRNIFSTIKEAVNNCVKHSGATGIKVDVSIHNSTLSIAITDNGAGFAENELKGTGNGLRNMKQRIASIGGQCTITSAIHEGTTVSIIIPFDKLNVEHH